MAVSFSGSSPIFLILSLTLFFLSPCHSDPDSLQDFCVADLRAQAVLNGFPCKPASAVTGEDFFFSGLTKEGNTSSTPFGAAVTIGGVMTFPGLNTLGLSMNRVDYAPGGVVIPHTHPRATEMVLVVKGSVLIGFVSTSNVLYSKVVGPGELFVIPMGLIHFQQNVGHGKAQAFTVFNSQNGGAVLLSPALFGSKPGIPNEVLARAFRIDEKLVKGIKFKFGA
ncbi:germin-like protein subfamily T member 1 [Aristolochia californica]|uniref:germin-like protein subfamily T member 1 n=1 Tax=Aristolochia californica TaxID=171875 RepID=UPI0035E00E6C